MVILLGLHLRADCEEEDTIHSFRTKKRGIGRNGIGQIVASSLMCICTSIKAAPPSFEASLPIEYVMPTEMLFASFEQLLVAGNLFPRLVSVYF